MKIVQKANESIKQWSREMPKLVIGLDGYVGVGKTTLLNNLVKLNPEILAVHLDDFLISAKDFEAKLATAEDRSGVFELEHHRFDEVENLIRDFRGNKPAHNTKIFNPQTGEVDTPITYDTSKKIMIVDGVFLFHPLRLNHLWDKRIYLDGDTKKIDERRVEREKARWGDKYFPETHPDSHFRQVILALKRYRQEYRPEQQADLVLFADQ